MQIFVCHQIDCQHGPFIVQAAFADSLQHSTDSKWITVDLKIAHTVS